MVTTEEILEAFQELAPPGSVCVSLPHSLTHACLRRCSGMSLFVLLTSVQPFVTVEKLEQCMGSDVASTLRTILPFSTTEEGAEVFNFEEYLAGGSL